MLGVASELLLAVAFHAIAAIWFYFTSASLFSTHTHTQPFNGPFSGTTRVGRYQKGKTNLYLTEARDGE